MTCALELLGEAETQFQLLLDQATPAEVKRKMGVMLQEEGAERTPLGSELEDGVSPLSSHLAGSF